MHFLFSTLPDVLNCDFIKTIPNDWPCFLRILGIKVQLFLEDHRLPTLDLLRSHFHTSDL